MIKDIIVHLDGSADDTNRIVYGEGVAASFGAHLRGLYLNILPEMHLSMAEFAAASAIITAAQDDARTQGDRIEQTLAHRFQTLAVPAEVRRFDLFAYELSETVASHARAVDLIVAARPYGRDKPEHWPRLVEAALFASGRGVLILPQAASTAHRPIETVLVAWNDTRESARALAEAMPFLEKARRVVVAMVDHNGVDDDGEGPAARIVRHLGYHGVTVDLRYSRSGNRTSDALFNDAKDLGADLVVLGAYGHWRLREWILGGVTRDFLTGCSVPMLMAH